jgi:hydrogenase nickel incorporation protein HypB
MAIHRVEVERSVLERNDEIAAELRERLAAHGVRAFNLVSSPGAGKTLLLERTLERLGDDVAIAVVTADVRTDRDAQRLARYTDRVIQAVETGGACHLEARQVRAAVETVDLGHTDLLLIENVGNLVCPAGFDLGEAAKVVVFSVTEGEDKPAKYPTMFRKARYAVLNKMDLLPHVSFDVGAAMAYAREVNPELQFFFTSALTGEGLDEWLDFLCAEAAAGAAIEGGHPVGTR